MKLLSRVYKLLSPNQKKEVWLVLLLIFIGLVLELLSVGLVFPIFDYAGHPEKLKKIEILFNLSHEITQDYFLLISMIFILSIYFFKTIFLYVSVKRQNWFATNIVKNLSQQLFRGYIEMPYLFHVNNNSSKLVRNVNVETGAFLALLQSLMILISESAIVLSVIILLLIVEFWVTIFMLLFFVSATIIFHVITKQRMEDLGKKRQYHDGEYSRHLLQGLNGIKDIKILGKETYFVDQLDWHNKIRTEILVKNNTIQQVPRLYLEFITIFALSTIVIYFVYRSVALTYFLPILGLYAASSFRLIPSFNRILVSLTTIKFHKSAIDEIEKESKFLQENIDLRNKFDRTPLEFNDVIKLENISFSYDKRSKSIFKDLNLKLTKGETIGIIGESGVGKSTLVDLIIGLLKPSTGSIYVDGTKLNPESSSLRKLVGYVPQSIFFIDDTLEKNIAFGVSECDINDSSLATAIKNSQLESLIGQMPNGLQTIIGERGVKLSGGQRQRIGIARALYLNPSILVFDEATSALDSETELAVMNTINSLKGGITIILIAHRISTLRECDVVYEIKNGSCKEVILL